MCFGRGSRTGQLLLEYSCEEAMAQTAHTKGCCMGLVASIRYPHLEELHSLPVLPPEGPYTPQAKLVCLSNRGMA